MAALVLISRESGRNAFGALVGDDLWAGATRRISRLQVPTAARANGALRKDKRLVRIGAALLVLLDDELGYAALTIGPLDARGPFASAAEPKPFFGRTALARYLNESFIDHDPVFRKRDGTVRQNNPNQTRTRLAPPARAKNRRF